MNIPAQLQYSKDHEWVQMDGRRVKIGITDFAQSQLGDVVFIELPEVGRQIVEGESFSVVESVKAVSDIYAPVAGTVVEVNEALTDAPEAVNQDPYGEGWIVIVELAEGRAPSQLLDAAAYEAITAEGGH